VKVRQALSSFHRDGIREFLGASLEYLQGLPEILKPGKEESGIHADAFIVWLQQQGLAELFRRTLVVAKRRLTLPRK
jgi:hypothetical protein